MLYKLGKAYFTEEMGGYPFTFQQQMLDLAKWNVACNLPSNKIHISIFSKMVKAEINALSACYQKQSSILSAIIHVQFTVLKNLYLIENQITNFEAIALLNSPFLSEVSFSGNSITSLRSLRKFKANHLQTIFISQNPIAELFALRHCPHRHLQYLQLEYTLTSAIVGQIIVPIMIAAESQSVQEINLNKKKRVSQVKSWKMLEERYGKQLNNVLK